MDECGEVIANECVEVLVQTGNRSEDDTQNEMVAEVDKGSVSSFDRLVRSAMALEEEDPRSEHSYAFGDKRHAVECKEKDHCYSSTSKHRNGPRASLSDDNIYLSSESISENAPLLLPHYQSKDSALDVTGFDTISEKCLSYENIDMKTVDVFTELLPSTSAPDVSFSRMSLQNQNKSNEMSSTSLPTSPCSKGKLTLDHTYSSIKKLTKRLRNDPKESPLLDHSYDSKIWSTVGMKRGRSTEEINFVNFGNCRTVKSTDFTKSPFLDHSYQSLEIKTHGKKLYKGWQASMNTCDKTTTVTARGNTSFPQPRLSDHTYEKLMGEPNHIGGNTVSRSRSNSLSSNTSRLSDMKVEHSYVSLMNIEDAEMKDTCSTAGSLSDSGTESLNDEEENNMLTASANWITYPDHSYVPQGDTHA